MLHLTTNMHWTGFDGPPSSAGGTAWRALSALLASFALLALVIVELGVGEGQATVAAGPQPVETVETVDAGAGTVEAVVDAGVEAGVDDGPVGEPNRVAEGTLPVSATSEPTSFAWRPLRASQDVQLDPRSVTRRFAADFLGMNTPSIGGFQPMADGSGLIEVRAEIGGPTTSVLLHRAGTDGAWSVVGASSEHITIEHPATNDTIDDPLRVSGQAIAADGRVELELWTVGEQEPLLVREFVIRDGDEPDWFEGSFGWTASGTADVGAVVFRLFDPDTGLVVEAEVVPVVLSPAGP